MRACAVRVTTVVFHGYSLCNCCLLAPECAFCGRYLTRGHVRWAVWGYWVIPGESHPCWSAVAAAVGVVVGGHEL